MSNRNLNDLPQFFHEFGSVLPLVLACSCCSIGWNRAVRNFLPHMQHYNFYSLHDFVSFLRAANISFLSQCFKWTLSVKSKPCRILKKWLISPKCLDIASLSCFYPPLQASSTDDRTFQLYEQLSFSYPSLLQPLIHERDTVSIFKLKNNSKVPDLRLQFHA